MVISVDLILEQHGLRLEARLIRRLEASFDRIQADEGTVWLLGPTKKALVPVWNSGPRARDFIGHHSQPLDVGLVSIVFVTEQCLCDNAVYQNDGQDPTLDRKLQLITCSMIAVPLQFRGATRGVVSCVRLKRSGTPEPGPASFASSDLIQFTKSIGEIEALVDAQGAAENAGRGNLQ